jgi:hypothetical protein
VENIFCFNFIFLSIDMCCPLSNRLSGKNHLKGFFARNLQKTSQELPVRKLEGFVKLRKWIKAPTATPSGVDAWTTGLKSHPLGHSTNQVSLSFKTNQQESDSQTLPLL